MGVGFCPVFEPEVASAKFDADGKALLDACQTLDRIAETLKLKPLSGFADNRPVPEGFDGDPYDLEDLIGEWDEWFAIAEGLETTEGLLIALKAGKPPTRLRHKEDVIGELEVLAECLRVAAKKKGVKFRLEVF